MDAFSQKELSGIAWALKLSAFSIVRVAESQKSEVAVFGNPPATLAERLMLVAFPPLETPPDQISSLNQIQLIITHKRRCAYILLGFRNALPSPFSRRPDPAQVQRLVVPCLTYEIDHLNTLSQSLLDETRLASTSTKALLAGFQNVNVKNPFEITLEQLLRLYSLEHGCIWELHDGQYLTLEAQINCDVRRYEKNCLPKDTGLVWESLQPGAPKILLRNNLQIDELQNRNLYDLFKNRPVYLVRLGEGENIYGVACLAGTPGTSIKSSDYSDTLLETFEQFLALELKSRRKDYNQSIFFTSIPKLLRHDKYTVSEICNTACEDLIQIMNCQAVSIFLKPNLDVGASYLEIAASRILVPEKPSEHDVKPSEQYEAFKKGATYSYLIGLKSLTGTVAFTEKPLIRNEVEKDAKNSNTYREIQERTNDTWIGVPIITPTKHCLGVLRCTGKLTHIEGHQFNYIFDTLDSQLLSNVASIIAPLIQHIQAAHELTAINERLATSERLKEHEMRGPLQLISSNSEFVIRHVDDASVTSKAQRLRDILTNVELCAMLLTSAKLPSKTDFRRQLQPIFVRNMLKVLVDALKHQIESRSPSQIIENAETGLFEMKVHPYVVIELVGNCTPIIGHRYLLQRALYNIANNAIKYAKWNEKGRLRIQIKEIPMDNHITITFEDNGIGVAEDESDLIFTKRFRGKGTSDRPGEGIGLKIARAIIEMHGGVLTLTSHYDPTRFEIQLPLRLASS